MSITINENTYFLFGLKFSFFICIKLSLPILLDITFSWFKQNSEQSKKREPYREIWVIMKGEGEYFIITYAFFY